MKYIIAVMVFAAAPMIGCAKKQRAVLGESAIVEGPSSVAATVSVTKPTVVSDRPAEGDNGAHFPIYFDYNSTELHAASRQELARLGSRMKQDEDLVLTIEGNCDERGSTEYNLALGERRATAAKTYLVRSGVLADRINVVSYGEEQPAVAGNDEEAWAKNRRDEFILSTN